MPSLYLKDPLFLFSLTTYFLNRLILKSIFTAGFFHNYWNDLICIPFWLPIMLYGMRLLGLRTHDAPPTWYELVISLLIWSFLFECWLPFTPAFQGLAYSDHVDVLCYVIGAFFAAEFWRFWYPQTELSQKQEEA